MLLLHSLLLPSSGSPCLGNNTTPQWVGLLPQLMYKDMATGWHGLDS